MSWRSRRHRLRGLIGGTALVLGIATPAAVAAGAEPAHEVEAAAHFDDANPAHFVEGEFTDQHGGKTDKSFDHLTPAVIADVIGADELHRRGITGEGVDIALIDTGVTPVPGIGTVINGPDLSFDNQVDDLRHLDANGHGTHLAGIVNGLAPDARLLNVKVGAVDGAVDVSQVIAAIDWVVQHRNDNGMDVRVITLAYGTQNRQPYTIDPLAHAVENAWRHGIVVVAAAGNGGAEHDRLTNPAIDPHIVAVGASDAQGTHKVGDDTVADFSSRSSSGRTVDLVAPGRSVVSLSTPGSFTDVRHPEGRVGDHGFRGSGTSQSAAVAAAAAALLIDADPQLDPDQVKAALVKSARKLKDHTAAQGAGLLDVEKASRQAKSHKGASQPWPTSTGTGTLEGARGDSHVEWGGVVLEGEQDIFGNPWDGASWSGASWSGASWSGGTWNGASWSGASWSGASWSGASWSGASWSGASWSGASWSSTAAS